MKRLIALIFSVLCLSASAINWTNYPFVSFPQAADTFLIGTLTPTPTNEQITGLNLQFWLLNQSTNYALALGVSSTNQSLLIGANATNDDLLFGSNGTNQTWLIGLNGTNQTWLIGQNDTNQSLKIGANATNDDWLIGQNITNAFILNSAGIGTNITLKYSLSFTNPIYGDSFFIDSTNHAFGFIQTNGNYWVYTNGVVYEQGTNTDWVGNFVATGWTSLRGTETNTTLTGPGLIAADANGGRSVATVGSGLSLSGGTLSATASGAYILSLNGFGTNTTFYGTNTFGTNANTGMRVIDGFGNETLYTTNGSLYLRYDQNTNVFFSLAGTNRQITMRGLIQIPTNGLPIGSTTDPGAGNLYASNTVSALGITNRTFAAIGVVTNDANGNTYTSPFLNLPVSNGAITNTSFAAIGVVTNDANGKLYTTPTLPSTLLGSGQAVYGGNTYTNEVVSQTFFQAPNASGGAAIADSSGITRCVLPANGTLANLYVIASGNPGAVANTVTIMTNGVATSITATLNNVTTANDTTHQVAALAGTEVGIKLVTGAGNAVKWGWGFQYR